MEQELKQRMIGVTVIVALAVIFVPMLFDKRADKERAVNGVPPIPENVMEHQLELPKSAEDLAPKDEKPADQSGFKIIPLSEAPMEKPEAKAAPSETKRETTAAEELSAPASEEEDFGVAEEKAAKPVEKPRREEPVKVPASVAVEKVAKPVAVERPPEPVRKVKPVEVAVKKTEPGAGAQPRTEPSPPIVKKPRAAEPAVSVAKPEAAPVSRPAAPQRPAAAAIAPPKPAAPDAAAARVQSAKPAQEPAAAPDVWVIQTGSFTSEAKARALAEKLRQSRFPAFVESAVSDHGTTYRVQVGPELDRGRAEQTQRQIESSAGIKGIIVPHP
jgi:DedD protein